MLLVCVMNIFPLLVYILSAEIPPHNASWPADVFVGSTIASVMHEEDHSWISDNRELVCHYHFPSGKNAALQSVPAGSKQFVPCKSLLLMVMATPLSFASLSLP